jgi:hypothetical protein
VIPIHHAPSDDERAAAAWWESLSAPRRNDWLQMADSTKPTDAWAEFKRRSQPPERDPSVGQANT